ncbi:MAG: IclR family transcriptional regulator [Pseudomonadota bacterium]
MNKPIKDPAGKSRYSYLVPAVEQAARILATLARHDSGRMTLTEICQVVGIHNSKGFSILNTLKRFALVQKDPTSKTYSLGMGLIFLSQKVLDGLDLRQAAKSFLGRLAEETDGMAFLGLIAEDHLYVAAKEQGTQLGGLSFRLGQRFPLFWGAHGKAMLAVLTDEERRSLGDTDGLAPKDLRLRYGSPKFEKELAQCRKNGYATSGDEVHMGIRAVAACVSGPTGRLIGAFVVIGPFQEKMTEKFGQSVLREAREFSRKLLGSYYEAEGSD